jgi:hypothetical protein
MRSRTTSSRERIGGYIGSHGPGSPVFAVTEAGVTVEDGVKGMPESPVVFVVVRVVMPGQGASVLSALEDSGVGDVGEAGQLEPPSVVESDCEFECL